VKGSESGRGRETGARLDDGTAQEMLLRRRVTRLTLDRREIRVRDLSPKRPTPPLALVRGNGEREHRRPDVSRFPARLVLAALPIALLLLWMWLAGGQRRAIEELPPADRLAAYRSSLAAFEALCAQPSADLEATCTERARLLIYFPECDTRCRQLTLPQLRPHRS